MYTGERGGATREKTMFDLVIRGGTVVTPASMNVADVGVQDGKIAQLGGDMQGHREIDARDRLVSPAASTFTSISPHPATPRLGLNSGPTTSTPAPWPPSPVA